MTCYSLSGIQPSLPPDENYWIAENAQLIGNVTLESNTTIWFGAVLRGDNEPIVVGEGTNIQDGSILHTDMGFPLTIGKNCTVGHRAILHGCVIDDGALIGMNATILNGVQIGQNSVIGACSLVTEGKVIPANSLFMGSPAKFVRTISQAEHEDFMTAALHYQANLKRYKSSFVAIK